MKRIFKRCISENEDAPTELIDTEELFEVIEKYLENALTEAKKEVVKEPLPVTEPAAKEIKREENKGKRPRETAQQGAKSEKQDIMSRLLPEGMHLG